jgi:hypothetical protein
MRSGIASSRRLVQTLLARPRAIERGYETTSSEKVGAALLLDGVQGHDVRVVEGGDGLRLALEALQAVGVGGHLRRKDLQRHLAVELRVLGQEDGSHAALADLALDAIVREALSGLKGHRRVP